MRLNYRPSDPRSPWAGPGLGRRDPRRALARAAVEARRSGGPEAWRAAAELRGLLGGWGLGLRGSAGRARGHRGVTGLP